MSTTKSLLPQRTTHIQNGINCDIYGVSFPLQIGVPVQTHFTFKFQPPSYSPICVTAGQVITANVPMVINHQNTYGTANGNPALVSAVLYQNSFNVQLPEDLNSPIAPSQFSTGPMVRSIMFPNLLDHVLYFYPVTNGATTQFICYVTIKGYDYRNVAVSETLIVNAGTGVFQSNKAYNSVFLIVFTADPGIQYSVGNGGAWGLPFALLDFQSIVCAWREQTYYTGNQLTGYVVPANTWRLNIPNNQPVLTGSPNISARGIFKDTVLTGTPDGDTVYSLTYVTYGNDSFFNAQLQNNALLGLPLVQNNTQQKILANVSALCQIKAQYFNPASNTSTNKGNPILGYLVPQDLTGVQYPGDMDVINQYRVQITQ